ncbi:hypothetical protein CRG98_044490, partial [Punica granatum]
LPGLLTRASLLFCFANSPSLLACASYNLASLTGFAHPCEFTFLLRKFAEPACLCLIQSCQFAEPARLCLIQSCRVCSPVRVYFSASQVRRACSLVPHTILPGLLTRASLLFCFASSPSLLACASYNLAGSAHPCEFTFLLRKFAEPARLCLIQSCRVCSPVRVYFSASQVRRACSLVPHTILPGLLTRASLLFCFASSPSLLACASYNLAGSAHPCEFTFLLRKFAEPARLCLIQSCRVCSPVRVYFSASQVRRACSLVPHTILPGLLTRASLLFCFASSPSLLACASYNLAGSAHPCEFTFLLRKCAEPPRLCLIQSCRVCSPFAEPARLCLKQSRRVCSPVRVYFSASQVRRACSLVPQTISPGLLTRASLLFRFASSPSLLACASNNLAGSAHPCEFTFPLRKFAEPARLCLKQSRRVCSPVRVYFSASQVRRACSLVPQTISPGLLTRASLLFRFASSPSLLACASNNLAGSAHPCEFTFPLRKFAEPSRSCLLQPCRFAEPSPSCLLRPYRVCSPVRVYFSASQIRRACSLVPHTILPGLLTRASLLYCCAISPSLFARASGNLAWSAHMCEFTFRLYKFAELARSCLLQPYWISTLVCSPVRVYFSASQVRRASSLVPHTILPGLLTRASLLYCCAISPSLFARASGNLAWSAHMCEFTFRLYKFAELARSCLLQPYWISTLVRVYFSASQVRRAFSLVPLATLLGMLTRASLLFCFAISPSLFARASGNLAWSAHMCEFTFRLYKFAELARSCLLQPYWISTLVRVYFSASQVRRAFSLVPLATLLGMLTRASLLFCFAGTPRLLVSASYYLAGSAHPCEFTFLLRRYAAPARTPRLLVSASYYLAGSAHPCEFTFLLRRYAAPARTPRLLVSASYYLAGSAHPCEFTFLLRRYAAPARTPRLLVSASYYLAGSAHPCEFTFLLRRYAAPARTPRLLVSASYYLAGSAHPCEFTFLLRRYAAPARTPRLLVSASYYLAGSAHPCEFTFLLRRYAAPARTPRLLVSASYYLAGSAHPCEFTFLLRRYAAPARTPRLLVSASYYLAGSAHPCEFTFLLRRYAAPARTPRLLVSASYYLAGSAHPCEFTFLLRRYAAPARTPRLLVSASYYLAGSAHPCEFTFLLRRYAAPARTPRLLVSASYNLAGSAHPCEFTFLLPKIAESARSCLLQPCLPARLCLIQSCRVCSPVRVYFSASQVRRASSLVPHTILPGLLTRASLLFCVASSPSLLACASYNLAGSAHPCVFIFFASQVRRAISIVPLAALPGCSPVRVYFSASPVRRDRSLVLIAALPGLLTGASLLFSFASSPSLLACASYNLAGSAHPCEITFLHRKFAEPARSCLLQPCRVCSPVRVYFTAAQFRRACSLVPPATLPGLLTCASLLYCCAISPSLLARASCNPAWSAHLCEFTLLLRNFAEPARSCLLQPCLVCSPVRVYFTAAQFRRACSLVPPATLPGLLTCASLLYCCAISPSLLARASCNPAWSAHLCEFTLLLRNFAEPARSCLLQPCLVCSPVRVYFTAAQFRRACSLVPPATLPGLLTCASLLYCCAISPSLLARASCNPAWSAHLCEFTLLLRNFAEPARSCLLQPCLVCSPVRVYFTAAQFRRACSLVPPATLPGLLTCASLLYCCAISPSLLARASCNPAWSAHLCEFTLLLRNFAEPARSCLLQPCLVCSPVRVYFTAAQFRRACSLVPPATLPGLLTCASLLYCCAISPSLLARASCNPAWSAHLCEFTLLLRNFAEPARSCLLQPCLVCSPVRVYFTAAQFRRACSLVPPATLPGLLTCASLLYCCAISPSLLARASCNPAWSAHLCEFTLLLRNFAEPARSCLLQPCLVCSPVRVYFTAAQFRRACSLVPPATLPGLLTCASLLYCCAISPSLLARASCNPAWSAHLCEFTLLLRNFAEPARSCLLQPCLVCSPVRVYFTAAQFRRACSLVPPATLPGLLTCASLLYCCAISPSLLARASCNPAWSAHLCEFTLLLRNFAEPARSCLLQPCLVCSPVRVYFTAAQFRRACSLVPPATLPGLLTCASLLYCCAISPSLLARASCNPAWSAHLCEFTLLLRNFAEPARSCLLQPCLVCSPVRVYFTAAQFRRACSLVPRATLLDLLTSASLIFRFASSPSLLTRATCNLAGSAHPCLFTFLLRKFVEPARLCLIQSCRVCSP